MPGQNEHEAYYTDDKGQRYKFRYTGDIPPTREQVLASVKDQATVNVRGVGGGAVGSGLDKLSAILAPATVENAKRLSSEASTRLTPYNATRRDPNHIPMAPGSPLVPGRSSPGTPIKDRLPLLQRCRMSRAPQ